MAPSPPLPPDMAIASHSIEIMTLAKVITDPQGAPLRIILTGQHGVEIKFPGFAYPFVKDGVEVLAIVSLVQITQAEPTLAPKLIIPQGG